MISDAPTPIPRFENREFERRQAITDRVWQKRDVDAIVAFLRSDEYERTTVLGAYDGDATYDLFFKTIDGQPGEFELAAFKAFIADGRVFRSPYGMLSILWRAWQYYAPMFIIIVSLIPNGTWQQMIAAVVHHISEPQPDPFRFPTNHFEDLVATCARYGRFAASQEQLAYMQTYLNSSFSEYDVDLWNALSIYLQRHTNGSPDYVAELTLLYNQARSRICERETFNVVKNLIAAGLTDERIMHLLETTSECYSRGLLTREKVTSMIEFVR